MARSFPRLLPVLAAALALAGCRLHIDPPGQWVGRSPDSPAATPSGSGAASGADAAERDPFKPWDDVLKDTRAVEGWLTFHRKRDGTVYLELPPDRLGQEFGLTIHVARGVSDFGINAGLPQAWETQLLRFRRVNDRVFLERLNPRFTAADGSPMRVALEANVAHSPVQSFRIESEHRETKHLLLDVTDFLLSDYGEVEEWLEAVYAGRPVSLDKERSHVERVQGFPRNVEIDAALTYRASNPPLLPADGVADYRAVPITLRYSFFALPEKPMRPREGDPRVGHFLTAVWDYSDTRSDNPRTYYVQRWRLEKRDPNAAVSEPVQPIVYWIDRSVPHEYRRWVREGIEAWNKAFEAAGFRNAIVVREAPEDDETWSAEDIRYSTVRWSADRFAWAIGPSQIDPRTGEILNADVVIASGFTNFLNLEYREFAGPDAWGLPGFAPGDAASAGSPARSGAMGPSALGPFAPSPPFGPFAEAERLIRRLPPRLADRLCFAQLGKAHQLAFQHTVLSVLGGLDEAGEGAGDDVAPNPDGALNAPPEYIGAAIRDLVMHEIGHTLGLRHNFKASSAMPYERLNDTTYTRRHGLTVSVMDYAPVNLSPDPRRQGHYFNVEVGAYDVWAIRYAYEPVAAEPADGALAFAGGPSAAVEAEREALRRIAAQAAEPLHAYGTDEDNYLGSWAVDPQINAWDLGSDPLRFARDRATIVARVLPGLERRLVRPGEGYQRLRSAFTTLLFERYSSLYPLTKLVGGLYTARDHAGDPNGRPPFTPVPAARQREAVRLLVEQAFAEGAFRFDPELLNKLAPNRLVADGWSDPWLVAPLDYPVLEQVGAIQASLLGALLDGARLRRMLNNELRTRPGEEAYGVHELLATLTGAIWAELETAPRNIDPFRRNLQRMYTDHLIRTALEVRAPFSLVPPEDARALARAELRGLSERIGRALDSPARLDAYTRAHLEDIRVRIDRALDAAVTAPVR